MMTERKKGRKAAIVIMTADPEICQLALRCATFHLAQSEDVSILLFVSKREAEKDCSSNSFHGGSFGSFVTAGGKVYYCSGRTELKKCLQDGFPMLSGETIYDLLNAGQLERVITSSIHIRVFR